ncbi:hypothetical protein [Halorarius halobius]|uniref:hypothetical protein n=1 Tax=Halorarius halobius TaxID=2962671 RepID=UPI0020CD34B2|nr:hypothetical protein [Halorarius halobius]
MSIDSSTDRPDREDFRRELQAELTADLDADQREYQCTHCPTLCINPADSQLYRARVCLDCHVAYLAGEPR